MRCGVSKIIAIAVASAATTVVAAGESIVVLYSAHNVEVAQMPCDTPGGIRICVPNAASLAVAFDDRLMAQLSINPLCHGVGVIRTTGLLDAFVVKEPHWWLTLDFALPNEPRQSWSLSMLEPGTLVVKIRHLSAAEV
jgi:hypothetical protein